MCGTMLAPEKGGWDQLPLPLLLALCAAAQLRGGCGTESPGERSFSCGPGQPCGLDCRKQLDPAQGAGTYHVLEQQKAVLLGGAGTLFWG